MWSMLQSSRSHLEHACRRMPVPRRTRTEDDAVEHAWRSTRSTLFDHHWWSTRSNCSMIVIRVTAVASTPPLVAAPGHPLRRHDVQELHGSIGRAGTYNPTGGIMRAASVPEIIVPPGQTPPEMATTRLIPLAGSQVACLRRACKTAVRFSVRVGQSATTYRLQVVFMKYVYLRKWLMNGCRETPFHREVSPSPVSPRRISQCPLFLTVATRRRMGNSNGVHPTTGCRSVLPTFLQPCDLCFNHHGATWSTLVEGCRCLERLAPKMAPRSTLERVRCSIIGKDVNNAMEVIRVTAVAELCTFAAAPGHSRRRHDVQGACQG